MGKWVAKWGGYGKWLKDKGRDLRLGPECEKAGKDLGAIILDDGRK